LYQVFQVLQSVLRRNDLVLLENYNNRIDLILLLILLQNQPRKTIKNKQKINKERLKVNQINESVFMVTNRKEKTKTLKH
jgi:hypothetical protein